MRIFFYTFYVLLLASLINPGFANAQQDRIDLKRYPALKKALGDIVMEVESKDFIKLIDNLSDKAKIRWTACGTFEPDDSYYEIDSMIKKLLQDSMAAQIKVYKVPRVVDPLREGKEYTTVLFTQGWLPPQSFRAFSFSSVDKKFWRLWAVCYDNEPPYDESTGSR